MKAVANCHICMQLNKHITPKEITELKISTDGDRYYFLECGHMFIVRATDSDKYQMS